MATLSDFYPYILPEVQGAPELVVDTQLKSAIIEFCEKSLIIQRDHDPVSVVKGISDYDFEPPITGHLVVKIVKAFCKGYELHPISPDSVDNPTIYNRLALDDKTILSGAPRNIFQKDERTFTLYPIPDETKANSLTMRIALKPNRSVETVEDVLYEDYAEHIASGCLARLMLSPNKTYTNPQLSVVHNNLFKQGINKAKQLSSRGFVRSVNKINIPRL